MGLKRIYKIKYQADGLFQSIKQGLLHVDTWRERLDFEESFSPIARFDTICTVLSIVARCHWKVCQFDVKSTFLNKTLEEEVYVQQPNGYEIVGHEDKVYRLRKAL